MAFPTTGLLDDFNRTDAGPPPSASWTGPLTDGGQSGAVKTNQYAAAGANGHGQDAWNTSYGPDSENFVTVAVVPVIDGDGDRLYVRCVDIGLTTFDGYVGRVLRTAGTVNQYQYHRADNTTHTQLGATVTTPTLANNDQLGVEMIGSTLIIYTNISAGGWTAVDAGRSDATYTAAGQLGIRVEANAGRLDNFSGGTAAAGGLTISPGAIGSAEAFGTGRLDLNAALTAIASAEAFGTSRLDLNVAANAIASVEAHGSSRLDFDLLMAAIASGEAFGTPRLDVNIAANAIATAEAFGTSRLDLNLAASAIASAEAFGTVRLDFLLLMAGLATEEAFGAPIVSLGSDQSVTGAGAIASVEAFGTGRLDFSLLMAALASAEAFGAARFDLNIEGAGAIASQEAHGAPRLDFEIAAAGIVGVEAFGTPQIDLLLLMQAIASGEAFGTVEIQGGEEEPAPPAQGWLLPNWSWLFAAMMAGPKELRAIQKKRKRKKSKEEEEQEAREAEEAAAREAVRLFLQQAVADAVELAKTEAAERERLATLKRRRNAAAMFLCD